MRHTKLERFESLFVRREGGEDHLYTPVCQKYGIDSKPPRANVHSMQMGKPPEKPSEQEAPGVPEDFIVSDCLPPKELQKPTESLDEKGEPHVEAEAP